MLLRYKSSKQNLLYQGVNMTILVAQYDKEKVRGMQAGTTKMDTAGLMAGARGIILMVNRIVNPFYLASELQIPKSGYKCSQRLQNDWLQWASRKLLPISFFTMYFAIRSI